MNKFKVGCFFTQDTEYQDIYLKYFKASCDKFDFEQCSTVSGNHGNWYRNVAEKPNMIMQTLSTMEKDECLVFLDVDATVNKYPQLFHDIPEEYDIAFHTLNWNLWYGYNAPNPVMELLTGTMFFRNNDKVKALCREWYDLAKNTNEWEQKVLAKILLDKPDIKVYNLPIEYCFLNSRPGGKEPLIDCEPVITHYQVSREMKRKIK